MANLPLCFSVLMAQTNRKSHAQNLDHQPVVNGVIL